MLFFYHVYNLDYFLLLSNIRKLCVNFRKVFVSDLPIPLHITLYQTSCFNIRETIAMIDKFRLTYFFILYRNKLTLDLRRLWIALRSKTMIHLCSELILRAEVVRIRILNKRSLERVEHLEFTLILLLRWIHHILRRAVFR